MGVPDTGAHPPALPLTHCSRWNPAGCAGHRNMTLPPPNERISKVGAVMTVRVCAADEVFAHASLALQVRVYSMVALEVLVVVLRMLTTGGWPLLSVTTGSSKTSGWPMSTMRSVIATKIGAVVSTTVMVWRPLALLPHASTAVQVRAMFCMPMPGLVTTSL